MPSDLYALRRKKKTEGCRKTVQDVCLRIIIQLMFAWIKVEEHLKW